MRVRLAQHILDCLKSDNFAMLLKIRLTESNVLIAASGHHAHFRRRSFDGYDLGATWRPFEEDGIVKGDWRFIFACKTGWPWNRKKWVDIEKYDGKNFRSVMSFSQVERDALYDAWHLYVEPAKIAEKLRAEQFMAEVDDADSWYP